MKFRFEIQKKPTGRRADREYSTNAPSEYPSFVLCFNYNWSDDIYYTSFGLHFWESEESKPIVLGELRLMKRDVVNTYESIKETVFSEFDDSFCSAGVNIDYYKILAYTFDNETCKALLNALRDCSINVDIQEQFREDPIYKKSIIRELDAERAIRMARFILEGTSVDEAFSFGFVYHAPYATKIDLPFIMKWKYAAQPYERWAGVIGPNGSGKTEMMIAFIKALLNDTDNYEDSRGYFVRKPVFSSTIALCTTPFDGYQDIHCDNSSINKYKCRSLEQDETRTFEDLKTGIQAIISRGRIYNEPLINDYERFLKGLLGDDIVAGLIIKPDIFNIDRKVDVDENVLGTLVNQLSSGQLHLMSLVTYVYQYVYYDTLFILDESEVHLYPHAIMDFMYLLSLLLNKFESYALVATHSPLVVREMTGEHVFVLRRMENDSPRFGQLDFESFGEDITLLYRKIFGYDETSSVFMKTVKHIVDKGKSYEEVIDSLKITMPLSLNSRMVINNLIATRDYYQYEKDPD